MSTDYERQIAEEEKVRFIRFVAVLVRHRRRILATAVAAAVLAVVFCLLRPEVYRARTVLFVGDTDTSARQLLAAQLEGGFLGAALGGGSSNSQLIGLILQSRSLADSLEARFGGFRRPDAEQLPNGSITVRVDDRNPARAAEIAGAYPVLINKIVAEVGRQMRERKGAALTEQLEEARARLEAVEQRAIAFQRTAAGPGLDEQISASVMSAIQIQRRIAEQEIVVQQLRRTSTPENAELRAAEAELASRRQQLQDLMRQGGGELLMPSFEESPELQVQATRMLRDLAEAQAIYTSVSTSLAGLQVTGSNELPAVSVLDPAIVPENPVNLKIWLVVSIAIILGLIGGSAIAFWSELSNAARRDPAYQPIYAAWAEPQPIAMPGVPRLPGREEQVSPEG